MLEWKNKDAFSNNILFTFLADNSKTRTALGKHDGHHYQKDLSDTWPETPFRHKRYFSVLRCRSLIAPTH